MVNMVHPAFIFSIVLGFAIGAAIYYLHNDQQPYTAYQVDHVEHADLAENSTRGICSQIKHQLRLIIYIFIPFYVRFAKNVGYLRPRRRRNSIHCTICLECLKFRKTKKLDCGHEFHDHCINIWVARSQTCPNCRAQYNI